MANPALDLHCDQPDPNWHPQTFGEACAYIDQLLRGTVQGNYTPYVIGSGTPAVSDQDKVWFKLGPDGQPLGFYAFYNGVWRKAYTGMYNEIRMYAGNPSFFFDTQGRGIIGGEYDGWHLANGLDGVINLTDKFIVSAHMDNSSGIPMYGGDRWQTGVTGAGTEEGGQKQVTLSPDQIPRARFPGLKTGFHTADGVGRTTDGPLWGKWDDTTDPDKVGEILAPIAANPDTETNPDAVVTPVWTLPPYIVLGFIVFTGYVPVST